MDTTINSLSSVQQRTPTKRNKPKKSKNKPVKVVYISNPMKVKTSASEFRALVQELTGQDAESPPDPSRFGGDDHGQFGGHKVGYDEGCEKEIGHAENYHRTLVTKDVDPNDIMVQGRKIGGVSSMEDFDLQFDDVFTPQMKESISALLPDSMLYEYAQVDRQVLTQCNFIRQ